MKTRRPRRKTVEVSLSPELYARIARYARVDRVSISTYILGALQAHQPEHMQEFIRERGDEAVAVSVGRSLLRESRYKVDR